ncbi:ABC transporter ATP-binding protein [Nocardioides alcanivorans]|uniref:ABC transporter ATP-binding protein n=1 Tax=Nocardioides alcanivorans TaxID=2897352 RepID=UPI001F2EBC48|nr:ABC transporter ATP-binding protein [Nocardioides alcanivorans]
MSTESKTPIVVVDNLRTVFHTARGDVRAVDGVSFTLKPGETLGLVGESGSGKSVLGRTVMGLISNDARTTVSGKVVLDGVDVHSVKGKERRKLWGPRVAMVFQDPMTSLNPVKRIGTHITEALRYHLNVNRKDAEERAIELLKQVGIPEPKRRMTQYPHEMSGGMRQRVVIAMALACDPKVLIADEPTTALDVTVQKQILDLIGSLTTERDMATLLVSHDLGAIAGRTDRVQVMYAGRTAEQGLTREVFGAPAHPYTDALLASIPQIENAPHSTLRTIEGNPPDMANPPAGCRFAPRCSFAEADCTSVLPVLEPMPGTDHSAACIHPLQAGAVREGSEPVHGR